MQFVYSMHVQFQVSCTYTVLYITFYIIYVPYNFIYILRED